LISRYFRETFSDLITEYYVEKQRKIEEEQQKIADIQAKAKQADERAEFARKKAEKDVWTGLFHAIFQVRLC
jgi:hypothetical protein